MDSTALNRATRVLQTVLATIEPTLVADGKAGRFTRAVYERAPGTTKAAINTLLKALGVPSAEELFMQVTQARATSSPETTSLFDLEVVPAVTRLALQQGIPPSLPLTQLALESNWGKSPIPTADGKPSYNYAGLKYNSVSQSGAVNVRRIPAATTEVIKGKELKMSQDFAGFESAMDFAKAYFEYLFKSKSSYRYPGLAKAKTMFEWGNILQKGGYATDPAYANKLVAVEKRVVAKYDIASTTALA